MAEKKIKEGDPVLFYGDVLTCTHVGKDPTNGHVMARCHDEAKMAARDQAAAEFKELRDSIVAEARQPNKKEAQDLDRLDSAMRNGVIRFTLRAELLSWWSRKELWVSDGRILSDDQRAAWLEMTGQTGKPHNYPRLERGALLALEDEGLA